MSLWHIAWSYLWSRKLTTFLTILSVSLGVGLITSVHTLRDETKRRFEEEGQAFDVVIGAKGSKLQLVLSSVYFMDIPTGNIPYTDYETIRKNPDVAAAFPIGLGDTYRGFRIVGTVRELFAHKWVMDYKGTERAPFQLAEGKLFEKPFEAVLGAIVAQQAGLRLGDTFVGAHGLGGDEHEEAPYTVVGILKPAATPNDRAIFCELESVWEVHDERPDKEKAGAEPDHDDDHHHAGREVTAVLVTLNTAGDRFTFVDYVNKNLNGMATIPVNEIQRLYAQVLSTVNIVLLAVAYMVVVVSALTIMIGLYLSILQRRRDLAIMRSLGASTVDIFGAVILEAFWVTMLGIGAGWLLGGGVSWGLGLYLSQRFGMTITPFGVSVDELESFAVVALVGFLAGILPAWQAYRTDVARDLARH